MTNHVIARMARMSGAELRWRAGAALRTVLDRASAALRPPRWHRSALIDVLGDEPGSTAIRSLSKGRAAYSMEPFRFEPVPSSIVATILDSAKNKPAARA